MDERINEIAQRIRGLREIMEITAAEMAAAAGVSESEYTELESGLRDLSFTFLYKCAGRFGVDLVELLTGENPHLSSYSITRAGGGIPIKRRQGFNYFHLASNLKNKTSESFLVEALYTQKAENSEISLSTHAGQELDFVLEGTLKFCYEGKIEMLHSGDCVYYDSGKGHGMVAAGGKDCRFLAVVMRDEKST